jgi:hypothetical protein
VTRSALPHRHHGKSDAESAMEPDGYHCPYCNGQSVDGSWTVAQLAAIEDETRYYAESQTHEMFKGMERQSNDFVKIKGRRSSESTEPSAANGAG